MLTDRCAQQAERTLQRVPFHSALVDGPLQIATHNLLLTSWAREEIPDSPRMLTTYPNSPQITSFQLF